MSSFSSFGRTPKYITRSAGVRVIVKHSRNLKTWRDIPGPPSLPILGSMHNFFPGGKLAGCKGLKLSERLHKLYGPIVKLNGMLGGYDNVFLFDPGATEQVLRGEDRLGAPERLSIESLTYFRQRYKKTYDPKRLTGLGTENGENWKQLRSLLNPIFMKPNAIKLYSEVISEIADEMIERLKSLRDKDNRITKNLDAEMNLWSLETVGLVALGTRLNCLKPDLPEDSPAKQLARTINDIFYVTEKLDFSPSLWKFFPTPMYRRAIKTFVECERLTKYFIEKAIANVKDSKRSNSTSEKSILEKLLELDFNIAYITAQEMIFGGIETTSHMVTATLYLLATHPEKQKKLREEVLGKDKKAYLRACIKEAMRVSPISAIGNNRLTTKEYDLLGYKIPKGVSIIFAQHYMPLLEENFPNAKEFIPERWLMDKEDPLYYGHSHPHTLAPFGFGVRMCVGRRLAQLEMETLISKVVENFQLEWPTSVPLNFAPSIINNVKEPYYFVFKDLPKITNTV